MPFACSTVSLWHWRSWACGSTRCRLPVFLVRIFRQEQPSRPSLRGQHQTCRRKDKTMTCTLAGHCKLLPWPSTYSSFFHDVRGRRMRGKSFPPLIAKGLINAFFILYFYEIFYNFLNRNGQRVYRCLAPNQKCIVGGEKTFEVGYLFSRTNFRLVFPIKGLVVESILPVYSCSSSFRLWWRGLKGQMFKINFVTFSQMDWNDFFHWKSNALWFFDSFPYSSQHIYGEHLLLAFITDALQHFPLTTAKNTFLNVRIRVCAEWDADLKNYGSC